MFEFIRRHTRLLQAVLVLLIFPSFVFFGIQGYSGFGDVSQRAVATVDGRKITQADWDLAHRNQIERVRRESPGIDASLFDGPEMRRQTLEALVRERVMLAAANDGHLVTSDERLLRIFSSDPQFAFLRNPDGSLNKELLAAQGMSSEQFAARLRQDLSLRQVTAGLSGSAIAPPAVTTAALDALLQRREVQVQRFEPKDYAPKIEASDAEIEAYYKEPANARRFEAPEQATIEYLVLDLDAIAKGVNVSEDELRKYYEQNEKRYVAPEERRASHILIEAAKDAPAPARAKAKEEAEALLEQVKKSPGSFAELAKKHSDDAGSAERGGDLDWFGRGAMTPPFEAAAFALKPGETSGLVETDFGYHIIRVTGARGGEKKGFEEVRAQIAADAKKREAERRYSEAAEQFSNLVYEQADSLKPAADKLGLGVQTATVLRQQAPGASGPLADRKFVDAIFSRDSLRTKRNTEAIQVAPNVLVSGRIVKHEPAHARPLAEVMKEVRGAVVQAKAAETAKKAGEALLAVGRGAPDTALSGKPQIVSRGDPQDVSFPVLEAVLKADANKLPAWIGVDLGPQGYAVARVLKVLPREAGAAEAARAQTQYAQVWSAAESAAYYRALKDRFGVEINPQPAPSEAIEPAPAASR